MRFSLGLLIAFVVPVVGEQRSTDISHEFVKTNTGEQIHALYAPTPRYPLSVRKQHKEGAGIFVLHMDKETGLVKSVTTKQTTGVALLDKSCKATFLRWRFPAHKVPREIIMPIAFNMVGKPE
jgi:TonB family protein